MKLYIRMVGLLSALLLTVGLASGCGGNSDTSSGSGSTTSSKTSSSTSSNSSADASTDTSADASTDVSTDTSGDTSSGGGTNSNTNSNTSSNSTTPPKPTARQLYDDTVENMGGYEFVIANPWMNREAPDNAGLVERMYHQRFDEVEKQYNCKIRITDFYGGMEALMPRIMAGDKVADILKMLPEMWIPAAGAGFLRPWNDVEDIVNFYDTRWIQTHLDTTLNGKNYIMEFERPAEGGATVLWYNRDVLKAAGIKDDPAQMAQKGTWTWDVFREMLQKITKASANRYGLGWADVYADPGRALAISNGAKAITEGSNGKLTTTYTDSKYLAAMNFLNQIVNVDKTMKIYPNMKKEETWGNMPAVQTLFTSFEKGLIGFISGRIWYGTNFKQMEGLDYGLVVYPKGPSASKYMTYAQTLQGYAMTRTNPDYVKTAKIFRAISRPIEDYAKDMAAYDEDTTAEFFMDGDNLSRQMMKLAADNGVIDLGYNVRTLGDALNVAQYGSIFWGTQTVDAAFQAIAGAYDKDVQDAFAKLP